MSVMARSCITVAVLVAGIGLAQQSAAQAPTLRPLSSTAPKAVGIPSDEEIKAFIATYKESATETIMMSASFTVPELEPDALRKFTKNGKVPYRVTFELAKFKTVNGETVSTGRLDGRATIAIFDENGALVKRTQEALGSLCPS